MRILSDNRRQIPFMRRRHPLSAAHVVNAPFCGHSSGLPCHGRTAAMRPAAERQRILRRRVESSDVPRHPPMWGASTKRDARRLTSPASPEMREPLSLKNMREAQPGGGFPLPVPGRRIRNLIEHRPGHTFGLPSRPASEVPYRAPLPEGRSVARCPYAALSSPSAHHHICVPARLDVDINTETRFRLCA